MLLGGRESTPARVTAVAVERLHAGGPGQPQAVIIVDHDVSFVICELTSQ
jgi:hypothetical protein